MELKASFTKTAKNIQHWTLSWILSTLCILSGPRTYFRRWRESLVCVVLIVPTVMSAMMNAGPILPIRHCLALGSYHLTQGYHAPSPTEHLPPLYHTLLYYIQWRSRTLWPEILRPCPVPANSFPTLWPHCETWSHTSSREVQLFTLDGTQQILQTGCNMPNSTQLVMLFICWH